MGAKPVMFNIQRFSTHDGPGIRTTVFFKGCPLRCAWCHNPESQAFAPELMVDAERCRGCGLCLRGCSRRAISIGADGRAVTDRGLCAACGACVDWCPEGIREIAGTVAPDAAELAQTLAADRMFFEKSGGGVTLSGGECLVQDTDYLEGLCHALGELGVRVAVDTCGYAPREHLERLVGLVDLWLFDLKAADDETHRAYTGVPLAPILDNLAYLASAGADINVRIPVIGTVNDDDATVQGMIGALKRVAGRPRVSLLPYHTAGNGKYRRLDRSQDAARADAFTVPDERAMGHIRSLFLEQGFADVEIGG